MAIKKAPALPDFIDDEQGLDNALALLGQIDADTAIVQTECEREANAVRERHQARLQRKHGHDTVSLTQLRSQLLMTIESYCVANRDLLLTSDVKSRQFKNGKIGWRCTPSSLDDTRAKADDSGASAWMSRIMKTVIAYLCTLPKVFRRVAPASVLRVRLEWNKSAILDRIKSQEIDLDELDPLGFAVIDGVEKFYCEPRVG